MCYTGAVDDVDDLPELARIGVRDLRNHVAAALRRAESGERIVVTVDGRPVAQLGPLQPGLGAPTLADLAGTGLLEPPRADRAGMTDPEPEDPPVDARVDRILDELRGR